MPVVTLQQVKDVTGVELPDEDGIVVAQGHLFVYGGVDVEDPEDPGLLDRLKARDRKLVLQAVCHQAAWLADVVDFAARMDVARIAGSTSTGGTDTRDEFTMALAPLAQACIKRLSWKNKRTTAAGPRRRRDRPGAGVVTAAEIHVSYDPADTPDQLANALTDAGPYWGEVADRPGTVPPY